MASYFVALLALCLAAGTVQGQGVCGRKPLVASPPWKIVGGENSVKGEWPWQISLRVRTWLGNSHICGGTLIDKNWVLTAAHCVDNNYAASSYVVRLGEHNTKVTDGTEVDFKVSQIIKHPNWDRNAINNDVALLRLASTVDLNGAHKHLGTICLAEPGIQVDGRMCVATGWGNTRYQGSMPDILQKVKVPVLEHNSCYKAYESVLAVTNGMICAGYDQGGKSVCQGDSGGPLQCQMEDGTWKQVGVTSWGVGCADPGYPGVYARVTTYRSWITSTAGISA